MTDTPLRPGRSLISFALIVYWFAAANCGSAQDDFPLRDEPTFRGQSPHGFASLPPEPTVPFGSSVSPWITASHATVNPPRIAQTPADPFGVPGYGGTPTFGTPGAGGLFLETPPVWHPYAAAQGKFGNERVLGISQLVVPLYQDGTSLLFSDIRGRLDDDQNYEGNFGLGHRTIVDNFWIFGFNGFFDLRKTREGSDFQQVGMGIEAMSVPFEARLNGYIPINESNLVAGPITAELIGNSIFLVGNEQRAYYGLDGEIGGLLWDDGYGGNELRGFVGGYYFDTNKDEFPSITGPKGRLEWRSYNIPMLGPESRLTLGVEAQWDDVRDFQVAGIARVEIPLGYGRSRPLSRLERRMLDRIVRDDDIVTHIARTPRELGIDNDTERLLNNVRVVNANTADIPGVVAAADPRNSTIIADGTAGPIQLGETIAIQDGQAFRGGGFLVRGQQTGTLVNFGTRPTINGTDPTADIVRITDAPAVTPDPGVPLDTIVRDIDFTGGRSAVTSNDGGGNFVDLTNVKIINNSVTGAAAGGVTLGGIDNLSVISGNLVDTNTGDGFTFFGDVAGLVDSNVASNNTGNGFRLAPGLVGAGNLTGTMTFNDAFANALNGISIAGDVSGSLDNHLVFGNGAAGINVNTVSGLLDGNFVFDNTGTGVNANSVSGLVTNNASFANGGTGFFVFGDVSGTMDGNFAVSNGANGIDLGAVSGLVSNNAADTNAGNGLFVFGDVSGSVDGNSAAGNQQSGFNITTLSGSVTNNLASENTIDGFRFGTVAAAGQVTGNTATNNLANGFHFTGPMAGTVSGNSSSGNTGVTGPGDASGNGFRFASTTTGQVSGNTAAENEDDGFEFVGDVGGQVSNNVSNNNGTLAGGSAFADGFQFLANVSGTVSGNQAVGNVNDGFFVQGTTTGTVSNNLAQDNRGNGFDFANTVSGVISGNTATGTTGTATSGGGDDALGNGFLFESSVPGNLNNNIATLNEDDGFDFIGAVGGIVQNNVSTNNGQNAGGSAFADGYQFRGAMSGTLLGNQASGNRDDGFFLGGNTNGIMTNNSASGNGSDGFVLLNLTGGTVFANTADANASDGFEIGSTNNGAVAGAWSGGSLLFNDSTNNTLFGYRVNNRTPFPATTAFGNTASGNGNNTLPTVP